MYIAVKAGGLKAPVTSEEAAKLMFCPAKSGGASPGASFFGVQKFVKFAESETFLSKADCNNYLTGICLAINL
jgi:hypothetical protein